MYTRKQLTECLWNAGLKPTDTVLVHSSATSVGEVENGTFGILDVFIDCFSREGLLIFPALTYTLIHLWEPGSERCRKCAVPEKYCFARGLGAHDVRKFHADMPCCVGKLPNLFLKRPGVVRSLSVSSSVAALGRDAVSFVSGHELCESGCSLGSPWWKLLERKGKILLIGVPLSRTTFFHGVFEWTMPERFRSPPFSMPVEVYNAAGERIASRESRPVSGYSGTFSAFETSLREAGALSDFHFGDAPAHLLDCEKSYQTVAGLLAKHPKEIS